MFVVIHTSCQLPLGGLEWRSIRSSSIDRESAAGVEWTLYQSSTEDDSQKTEPPLKDFIVSVQNKPMEFLQVLATLFTVMCVVSYLCFFFFWGDPSSGWNYCHFRCGKPEAEGARGLPLLLPSIGQEACMVLWPLIWGFDGVSVPRSFWIWWMPICPKGPEVRPCGVDEEQTRVTRGISFWNLCHPFPSSMPSPDFSEHHTYMANCLLGISMWMSERHLKFNIQKWNLGLSTLHPLPNLLFPSVFP